MKRRFHGLLFVPSLAGLLLVSGWTGWAAVRDVPLPASGALSTDLRATGFGLFNEPAVPRSSAVDVDRYEGRFELRPDFRIEYPALRLTAKPRLGLGYVERYSGPGDMYDTEAEGYLNEAVLRLSLRDELFLHGGRENLQWGPSQLVSLSNPFNPSNGRDDPARELAGMDFVRAVWVPRTMWALSLIANVGEGRAEWLDPRGPFERIYAAKLDYTGMGHYASLVGSIREKDDTDATLGGYAGINAGEATLLYVEGNVPPDTDRFQALVGGSYTFIWSGMLSLEYLHNGGGARDGDLPPLPDMSCRECKELPEIPEVGAFARKNYLFLQYYDSYRDRTDVTVRLTYGLDDESGRLTGIVWHALNDYLSAFAVAHVEEGGEGAEFERILRGSITAGLSASY